MALLTDFNTLLRFYDASADGAAIQRTTVKLSTAPQSSGEPGRVMAYLEAFGSRPRDLLELYEAVAALDDEELAAFQCSEGVAVTHASDGWWVLFIEDTPPS